MNVKRFIGVSPEKKKIQFNELQWHLIITNIYSVCVFVCVSHRVEESWEHENELQNVYCTQIISSDVRVENKYKHSTYVSMLYEYIECGEPVVYWYNNESVPSLITGVSLLSIKFMEFVAC